uniref:hypothetical protein n=1 Tax=Acidithiobacillus caldus TaxID=33059 RepID=UPI00155D98E9|nr:hypothetical protein [Acidithiobacillus caldus]
MDLFLFSDPGVVDKEVGIVNENFIVYAFWFWGWILHCFLILGVESGKPLFNVHAVFLKILFRYIESVGIVTIAIQRDDFLNSSVNGRF